MRNGKMLLLIDGANLYGTVKSLGFDLDYKKLLSEFRSRGDLLRANYYTALDEDEEVSSITPLIDWLDYNGYSVISKPVKSFTDAEGRRKRNGNMDVEIAVDAMEMAPHVEHVFLFSGDGDFRSLVEAVQRRGVHVTVVSSTATRPPMCADELRPSLWRRPPTGHQLVCDNRASVFPRPCAVSKNLRKHELECMRLAADCLQLAGDGRSAWQSSRP